MTCLVALVFLGANAEVSVMTFQLAQMIGTRGEHGIF